MKIVAGALKGRVIGFKPNPHLRPTSEKTRKAIFDVLQGQMEGKNVLDLFSGTGALGIEALSRGAAQAVFIEKEKNQARQIRENLEALGLLDRSRIIAADAVQALGRLNEYFDFIFLDPPYNEGWTEKTLATLSKTPLFHEATIVIAECGQREKPLSRIGKFKSVKIKAYGDTQIVFYKPVVV
ncbi:MAG: 16S rRNA (guanine(966)-N(2))-methyltransferase RsmD [Candidatus Omnitrophica bacterium]|nr:16S rRNA (guanine(966)-N(2))-methyltransferase RsmD [Candidatus Omnitrophota bacterium]